jgi:hypothetical protein
MTEPEWIVCADPVRMQEILRLSGGVRRLCLFATACCRQWPGFMADEDRLAALDVVEQFVDGGVWDDDRGRARALTQEVLSAVTEDDGLPMPRTTAGALLDRDLVRAAVVELDANVRCSMIREVLGNPYQRISLNPRWLNWSNKTVLRIARSLYDTRNFDGMPVLADTLMEAGCGNRDILEHCRQEGGHVLGCWVLDRILGKD